MCFFLAMVVAMVSSSPVVSRRVISQACTRIQTQRPAGGLDLGSGMNSSSKFGAYCTEILFASELAQQWRWTGQ